MTTLGGIGVWSSGLRSLEPAAAADAAAELEELGFSAVWLAGGTGSGVLDTVAAILAGTRRIVVATGILSVHTAPPEAVAETHARLAGAHPGRFLLGLGVSHSRFVDADGSRRYGRPLAVMRSYLDALDAAPAPVPAGERVLAALRPRMLALAGERSAGAHPYLVTPEHTRGARALLGPEPLLAPEQTVVLEDDPATAREIVRRHLAIYLKLDNYLRLWRELGFGEEDFAGGGSDRLVDALVPWGGEEVAGAAVEAHRRAGADHVCVQAAAGERDAVPRASWRRLADALLG